MSGPRKPRDETAEQLRAEHRREHREHLSWRRDLEGWRDEHVRAVVEFVRRTRPELGLTAFHSALDAHEVAIDAHEEMLRRHERMLAAEERGGPVTSDEIASFQAEIEDRHGRSREQHRLLEVTHGAILQALRMIDRSGTAD